jgi:hypothetical protein
MDYCRFGTFLYCVCVDFLYNVSTQYKQVFKIIKYYFGLQQTSGRCINMSPYEAKMTLSTLFIESMVISTITANQVNRMAIPFIRDRIACNPTSSLVVKKTWPNQASRMKRPEFQSTQTSRNLSMKSPREEDPPKTNRFKLGKAYLNDTSERPNLDLKSFNTDLKNYMTVYAHKETPSVKRFNAEYYCIPEALQSTKTAPSSEPSKSSESNFNGGMKFYMTKHVNMDVEDTDVTLRPVQGPILKMRLLALVVVVLTGIRLGVL